ncbi:MAG: penicillin-binding transpeptidase domain-containing protein [Bacilli bacterium]|jgi:penicillin-binding protein 2B
MKKRKRKEGRLKVSILLVIFAFFLFIIIGIELTKLSLMETVNGINLKKFASNRNTERQTLVAYRGSIFNSDGDSLAQTIDSYKVIAYLSEKRSSGFKKPQHVVDKELTAKKLSPILEISEDRLIELLSQDLYQIEFGSKGKDITELTKEKIENLNLPGIDFIKTYRRYYPQNDFLSYTLGYVQKYDENLVGEMGIELYYDDYLKGSDGYFEYQKDLNGYRLPHTPEIRKEAVDGMDIYLTIDNNIQMFVEQTVKDTTYKYNPDWMLMVVAEAKTGKILGTSSTPSFNPNTKNIISYLNPLVGYTFEPGSTMKTFSYMAAIEKGTYQGDQTFLSGQKVVGEHTIRDWNRKGWGRISFDRGFTLSSNVGASTMVEEFLGKNDLLNFYKLLGFGEKTGFTLPKEASGEVKFKYEIEVANAAFGQGLTVTPIQMIQALTVIANEGIMLKPYIVEKIVDPNTKKIVEQNQREEIRKVASLKTIEQIKDLMYDVIHLSSKETTGYYYNVFGYDIIGKTGTAQYVDPVTKRYLDGKHDYIRSFVGLFPKDNPEIIVYTVIKRPSYGESEAVQKSTNRLIDDIVKYLNLSSNSNNDNKENIVSFKMPNLLNKDLSFALNKLESTSNNIIIIGNGEKIINQYPNLDVLVNSKDKLFLVTNNQEIIIPSLKEWSRREVLTYCHLSNLKCQIEGYGYVYQQEFVDDLLTVKLKNILEEK